METIEAKKSRGVIGIDPGKSGAIAWIGDEQKGVCKMPDTVGDLIDELRGLVFDGYTIAYLERVHSSPQMGVVSSFTFGRGLGQIEAACQAVGISIEWVNPAAWQKAMGCLSKGDKNVTKRRAQELFPLFQMAHWKADALLIAEHGRRTELSRKS